MDPVYVSADIVSIDTAMLVFTSRRATATDLPKLAQLIKLAIEHLQAGYLDARQVAASHQVMSLDSQLVIDGTYFVVEERGSIAGCGGWSRRATLYGGDRSAVARESRVLDPATESARIRAMYTHPDFARRGVARLILRLCEADAAAEGFSNVEMMATLAGEPLYRAAGYREIERVEDRVGDVAVPLIRMGKRLSPRSA